MGLWSLKDYGIAAIILAFGSTACLIAVGVFLIGGILTAFLTGWLNTIIYTLAGVGIFACVKWAGLPKVTSWAYLSLLAIPVMGLLGYGINHTSYLTMLPSTNSLLGSTIVLSQNSLTGEIFSFVISPQVFGAIMLAVGLLCGALLYRKLHKKHH